ncbi:MAG: Ig-like domain-containing protein [Planctomycetota bacterium]
MRRNIVRFVVLAGIAWSSGQSARAQQGFVLYQMVSDPDFIMVCGQDELGNVTPTREVAEEVHMVGEGYLASFTFAYNVLSSPGVPDSGTATAIVNFYTNDANDSITPPAGLIASYTIPDLVWNNNVFYLRSFNIPDPIPVPRDLWVGVTILSPPGTAGSMAGAVDIFGGDPSVAHGTSHNLTWFGPSDCFPDGFLYHHDDDGFVANYYMDIRVFFDDSACQHPVPNGSFETASLTPQWSSIGRRTILGPDFNSPAPSGGLQAGMSTGDQLHFSATEPPVPAATLESFLSLPAGTLAGLGSGTPVEGSGLKQTITVGAHDTLQFRWKFLTDEATPDLTFNDFGFVTIVSGQAVLLANTLFPTFSDSPTVFGKETPTETFSYTFSSAATITVGFGVVDVTDSEVDSALLIDCVELIPPERDPPVVVITSPGTKPNGDPLVFGTTSVAVTGTVADASATTVTSDPAGIAPNSLPPGSHDVSGTLPLLNEGLDTLSINAVDSVDNTGGTSITVIRDTTAPAISVVAPAMNAVFGMSPVTLTVDVLDATATTVTFGGHTFDLASGGNRIVGMVALAEGANDIAITATDEGHNSTVSTLHLILDTEAPIVTIDSPANGACFGPGNTSIAVTATVDDFTATAVSSSPAGVVGSLPAGGGIVAGVIALDEGSNLITVNATDDSHLTGSASVSVVLDTIAPAVSIVTPSDGTFVRGEIEIEVRANDPLPGSGVSSVDIRVDGSTIASLPEPPYELDLDTHGLADGPHTIAGLAADGKANARTTSVVIMVDNTVPALGIVSPFDGAWARGTIAFEVQGSDSGAGLLSMTMQAGGQAPTNDASTTYPTPVASDVRSGSEDTTRHNDGPLALTALAVDAVGNQAQTSVIVNVDNTAPQKSLTTPLDGQIVSGSLTITATSSDANLANIEIIVNGLSQTSTTSPLSVLFDTTTVLDGPLPIEVRVTDRAGNTSSCTATVQVDNLAFDLKPTAIHLFGKAKEVRATVEGPNVALLVPTDLHQLQLRVPGGSPVNALASYKGKDDVRDRDRDGKPEIIVNFDRRALVAAIQAGMAANLIQADSNVTVTLTADSGSRVIGTDILKVKCGQRCNHDDED